MNIKKCYSHYIITYTTYFPQINNLFTYLFLKKNALELNNIQVLMSHNKNNNIFYILCFLYIFHY